MTESKSIPLQDWHEKQAEMYAGQDPVFWAEEIQQHYEFAALLRRTVTALEDVLYAILYETPAGTTNCRLCDEDMDHEGTHKNMHAEDCPFRKVDVDDVLYAAYQGSQTS